MLTKNNCKTLSFIFALLVQLVYLTHTSTAQDDAACLDSVNGVPHYYEQVEAEVPRVGLRGDGLLEVWRSFYPTPYWPGSGCNSTGIGVVDPATHLFQNGINGGFTKESISLSLRSTPAVVTKSDGTVAFFGEWLNDNSTQSIARFGDVFENLSGQFFSEPSAAVNQDGRMEIFAIGFSGVIWHIWQTTPNGGWSSWQSMGAQVIKDDTYGYIHPLVVRNTDGRLELFIWGLDKAIWHAAQTCPGCGWGVWTTLSGQLQSIPSVVVNADGKLEVFARGIDRAMWHIKQVAPGGGWGQWSSLSGQLYNNPNAILNSDGRVEIFALGQDGAIWHIWQTSPGGGWAQWSSLSGQLQDSPSPVRNADGRLEIFANGSIDKEIWHIAQTSAGGGWGHWHPYHESAKETPPPPPPPGGGGGGHTCSPTRVTGHLPIC
jgi:hypothetical protein